MLTVSEMQQIFDRVTYKPGWWFDVYQGAWEGPHVHIIAQGLPNAYGGQPVDIGIHSMIPPMTSERQLVAWLAWRLERIEVHEMREFLKLDGEIVFDPHAPDAGEDRR